MTARWLYVAAFAGVLALAATAAIGRHIVNEDLACAQALGSCGAAIDCEPWAKRCGWLP